MKTPIPSFRKIRLVFLILGFFFVCFFLGLIRNALAVQGIPYNGKCYALQLSPGSTLTSFGGYWWSLTNNDFRYTWYQQPNSSISTGYKYTTYKSFFWNSSISTWTLEDYRFGAFKPAVVDTIKAKMDSLGMPLSSAPDTYWASGPQNLQTCDAPQACTKKYLAKIEECFGEEHIEDFDYTTCTGTCEPSECNDPQCQEQQLGEPPSQCNN